MNCIQAYLSSSKTKSNLTDKCVFTVTVTVIRKKQQICIKLTEIKRTNEEPGKKIEPSLISAALQESNSTFADCLPINRRNCCLFLFCTVNVELLLPVVFMCFVSEVRGQNLRACED